MQHAELLSKASKLVYELQPDFNQLPQSTIHKLLALGYDLDSLKFYERGEDAFFYGELPNLGLATVVFRGTLAPKLPYNLYNAARILEDWGNNTRVNQVATLGITGQVHAGFNASLNNLWKPMCDCLTNDLPLALGGHSKGGALAVLAAAQLRTRVKEVHTFAAPKAGNACFAKAYNNRYCQITYRHEYQDDLVPHLPCASPALQYLFNTMTWKSPLTSAWLAIKTLFRGKACVYTPVGRLVFYGWSNPPSAYVDWLDRSIVHNYQKIPKHVLDAERRKSLKEAAERLNFARVVADHEGYSAESYIPLRSLTNG